MQKVTPGNRKWLAGLGGGWRGGCTCWVPGQARWRLCMVTTSLPAWWLVPVLPSRFLSSFGSNYIYLPRFFFQCFWWFHLNVLHDLCFICLKNPKCQISPGSFQLLCNSPLMAAAGTSWWLTDDMYCGPLSLIPSPDAQYHFLDASQILETELFSLISSSLKFLLSGNDITHISSFIDLFLTFVSSSPVLWLTNVQGLGYRNSL